MAKLCRCLCRIICFKSLHAATIVIPYLMNSRAGTILRHALDILLFLILGVISVLGFHSAWNDVVQSKKLWEFVTTAIVFLYAVAGTIAFWGLLRKKYWSLIFVMIWGVGCMMAGGLATVVWGEQGLATGAIAAASVLIIVIPVFYWTRKMVSRAKPN